MYSAPVAPAMSASDVPSFAIHCQAKAALASPSVSAMPDADAVSVSPTCAVPEIIGRPVGTVFTAAVASLISVSSVPPSSVKVTRTWIVLPASADVSV